MKQTFRAGAPYKALFASILLMAVGYGMYKGVLDNYLAEMVGMGELGKGVTEFFRELPGLMLIFILALLYRLPASKIYKLGGVLMVAGMAMQALISPSRVLVTLAISLYSTGEHIQLGMKNTLSLEYAAEGRGGQALGWQNSVYQAGNLAGYLVVIPLFLLVSSAKLYRPVFAAAAVFMLLALLAALRLTGGARPDASGSRFCFRRKFRTYYLLEVFYGARKQVFFTFGPYVLVLFYGVNAAVISLLFAISAVACFVLSPLVGRLIDRVGYKPIMVGDTLILVIVCFFYGFAHHIFPRNIALIVCCVNYVLDSVISLASMASNVYVQDLASDPEELRATISTGISVNHMITVLVALFGGWIWQTLGVETLFVLSAVLGLCNSAYAATIRVPEKTKT